jgi:hypothetical protein
LEVLRRERKEENENWIGNQMKKYVLAMCGVWCVVYGVRLLLRCNFRVPLVSTMEVEVNSVRAQSPQKRIQFSQKHIMHDA